MATYTLTPSPVKFLNRILGGGVNLEPLDSVRRSNQGLQLSRIFDLVEGWFRETIKKVIAEGDLRPAAEGEPLFTTINNLALAAGDFFTARFEGDPPAAAASGGAASDSDIALMLFLANELEAARKRR